MLRYDPDGAWPCQPVREVLDDLNSRDIGLGFVVGKRNLRGVTSRRAGEGGDQERQLVEEYRGYADKVIDKWPFTAKLLNDIADDYERKARWHDDVAERRDWE